MSVQMHVCLCVCRSKDNLSWPHPPCLCVCMCVHMKACVHTCQHKCMCTHGGVHVCHSAHVKVRGHLQVLISALFEPGSLCCVPLKSLLSPPSPLPHSRNTETTGTPYCIKLYMGSRDLSSGPHAYEAAALPTEAFSSLLKTIFALM